LKGAVGPRKCLIPQYSRRRSSYNAVADWHSTSSASFVVNFDWDKQENAFAR
jgi:hypothetical protein